MYTVDSSKGKICIKNMILSKVVVTMDDLAIAEQLASLMTREHITKISQWEREPFSIRRYYESHMKSSMRLDR